MPIEAPTNTTGSYAGSESGQSMWENMRVKWSPVMQKYFGSGSVTAPLTHLWKPKASMENGSEGFYHGVTIFILVVVLLLIVGAVITAVGVSKTSIGSRFRDMIKDRDVFSLN
jgi:hypothetical protein